MNAMTIDSLAGGIQANQISTQLSVAILSKQLDQQQTEGSSLIDMLERSTLENSVTPHIGGNIDTFV